MITIVNYGVGNLGSISNMLKKVGSNSIITSDVKEIEKAEKLILPGVGAFDNGIANLEDLNLIEVLNYKALTEKKPILGICLGMQLMTRSSEEGIKKGLNWFDAETKKFNFNTAEHQKLKIPNMGWKYVDEKKQTQLSPNMSSNSRFYFVHSYFVQANNKADEWLTAEYGVTYTAALQKENIFAVQFHPEKSHKYGMGLLKNFISL